MKNIIIALLIANAIAHVFSYIKLNKQKDPGATGVLAFVFINAIVAALFWLEFDWSKWLLYHLCFRCCVGCINTHLLYFIKINLQ